MATNKVVYAGNTLIDLTDTTATAADVAQGKYFYTAGGTKTQGTATGGTYQAKTNINPTTSSQTITPDAGYDGLSSVQINAMPSGTAGTPTAVKGTVSNHSVAVTPSVTNTTGYITGGTQTGTAVTVSASELVSGTLPISANGTGIDVSTYSAVDVDVVPNLTNKVVTPGDDTIIVTADTDTGSKFAFNIGPTSHTAGVNGNTTTSASPSYAFTENKKYRLIGRMNVKDSNGILEYYDIDSVIVWNTDYQTIMEGDSDSYFASLQVCKASSSDNIRLKYYYGKTATYGFEWNPSIYELSVYDGLSNVTVNPSIYTEKWVKDYISRSSACTDVVWPSGLTSLGSYAFAGCANFNPPSLPEGLITINSYAFYGCTKLALTSLPSSVRSINGNAFQNCNALALTSLPSNQTSITGSTFYGCTNLALTSLPEGVTAIYSNAFYNCTNMPLSSLPSGVTNIANYAFYGCENITLSSLPSGLTEIASYSFYNCKRMTLTSLPNVTAIRSSAFDGCENIELTTLPSTLTIMETNAFRNCVKFKNISCDGALTNLGGFNGNSTHEMLLETASFPNFDTSSYVSTVFGSATAANACQHLEFVDLGKARGISASAFANCYSLQTLVLRYTSGTCALSSVSAFTNTPLSGYNGLTGTVYVPSNKISTYKTATNWSTLYNGGTVTFEAIEGSEYELD